MRVLLAFLFAGIAAFGSAQDGAWQNALKPFGLEGTETNGSYVVARYRTDLQVQNASGMLIPPEMGLTSTVRLSGPVEDGSFEGEICLTQPEIDPVVDDLRGAKIEIDALGNRFAGETPGVYFLRFHGRGPAAKIGPAIRAALAELGKDRLISEGLNRTGKVPIVDWQAVSAALGRPVEKVGESEVRRAELGRSWVAFGGCPCGRTQLIGLINIQPEKLQDALDEVRRNRISVNSIVLSGSSAEIGIESEGDAKDLAMAMRRIWAVKNP
ncbi:MAG TPA: DUF1259 domain-containing protein [Fimbriimonadaceae bacterium]|nr:DUF1259 domain-containing protein [Fimbriimonadaceae bacterium]